MIWRDESQSSLPVIENDREVLHYTAAQDRFNRYGPFPVRSSHTETRVRGDSRCVYLYLRATYAKNNWLGLQLVATKSNPAAAGAIIAWQVGGLKRSRLKTAGGSYLSSHDPREILGLGAAKKIDYVEIRWPGGKIDKLTNLPINTYLKVIEGECIAKIVASPAK